MTERDLDRIQSRSEFQAWVPAPKPQPIDPEDDVPMGRCEDAPREKVIHNRTLSP